MTVPATVERNDYTGNGTTATYAYGFRITAQTHLKVTVADADGAETELDIGTDYTVTGVGVKTGGNIVLVDNGQDWIDVNSYFSDGWIMAVRHYVPLTQSTDIRNQGTFYPEIHEDAFDYLMWAIKQQQDELDRCVKAGETGGDIPTPAELTATLAATEDAQAAAEAAQAAAELAEDNAETAQGLAEAAQAAAEAAAIDSVKLTGDQTVAGIKTFSSSPIVPAPTTNYQATTKEYVDSKFPFGNIIDKSGDYGSQVASTDGIVTARGTATASANASLVGTFGGYNVQQNAYGAIDIVVSICFSVKKGETWSVSATNMTISNVYFRPIGT